jgi:hypothetical protein
VISDTGITPDLEKVTALRYFPAPTDDTSLQSYLGLANQLGSFLPDLSQSTSLMRTLLRKDTAFVWTADIQQQFEKSKNIFVIFSSRLLEVSVKTLLARIRARSLMLSCTVHIRTHVILNYILNAPSPFFLFSCS